MRNRYRRSLLDEKLREEIVPKNILMMGPTGVGKTEIARRIAKLVGAPFVKIEATKFTEVGYVGRDVESMVRDLVETSVRLVKEEKMNEVKGIAEENANKRLVRLLVPGRKNRQVRKILLKCCLAEIRIKKLVKRKSKKTRISKTTGNGLRISLLSANLKTIMSPLRWRSSSRPCLICSKARVWNRWA